MKKKRREMEQASLDAASDLLDTDSNATFAMVWFNEHINYRFRALFRPLDGVGGKETIWNLKLKFEMQFYMHMKVSSVGGMGLMESVL